MWEKLEAGEEIVITRNGKPFALLVHAEPEQLEQTLRAVRAERFAATVRKMQQHAASRGLDKMTPEEIDAEIALARKERKAAGAGGR